MAPGVDIASAYGRTSDAGPARAHFSYASGIDKAQWGDAIRRSPLLIRVASWPIRALFRRYLRAEDLSRLRWDAVVDLANQRCTLTAETGPNQVIVGNRMWFGRVGEPLDAEDALPAGAEQPLWFLALLQGIVESTGGGESVVGGTHCQRFEVTVDLTRASELSGEGLAPAQVRRVEELAALKLTVDLDSAGRIRRVGTGDRMSARGHTDYVLELLEFEVVPEPGFESLPLTNAQ